MRKIVHKKEELGEESQVRNISAFHTFYMAHMILGFPLNAYYIDKDWTIQDLT